QPKPEDINLIMLVMQIEQTNQIPESFGDIGRWEKELEPLIESYKEDGVKGFAAAKKRLLNRYSHLQPLYNTYQQNQTQAAEQEPERDTRIIVDQRGKRVFKT